jgi:hypothetical protein
MDKMPNRIAFAGSSGTGKTTLAKYIADEFKLPINPVGSRSVSEAMGFASPYDVDKAGRRAEFQHRIVTEKRAWEDAHEEFVTDRTTLDNLVYTMFHDVHAVSESLYDSVIQGLSRYTLVIYCPFSSFCNPNGDSARVQDMTYHKLFDTVLRAMIQKHLPKSVWYRELGAQDLESRKKLIRGYINRKVPRP